MADVGAGVDGVVHVCGYELVGLRNARAIADEVGKDNTDVSVGKVDWLPHNFDELRSPEESSALTK